MTKDKNVEIRNDTFDLLYEKHKLTITQIQDVISELDHKLKNIDAYFKFCLKCERPNDIKNVRCYHCGEAL